MRRIAMLGCVGLVASACGESPGVAGSSTGDAESGQSDGVTSDADATTATTMESTEASGGDSGDTGDTEDGPLPEPVVDPWSSATAGPFDFILGPVHTVHEASADFDFGSFPFAINAPRTDGVPGTRAFVTFSESPDASDAVIVTRMMATTDLGTSYETIEDNAAVENASLLADQTMLGVGFVPTWASGEHTAILEVSRSNDGGLSWSTEAGMFDAGEVGGQIRGLRFHRGLIEIPSGPDAGTLLVPFYGLLGSDERRTIELAASEDGGENWSRWGVIIPPDDPSLRNDETTVEYASDGTMIAVTRNVVVGDPNPQGPLLICRSADDGRTFSAVEPIEISFDGAPPAPKVGVDPHLHRLPNGALLLAGGRPDNWVAISDDNGETWNDAKTTYVNYPEFGLRTHGSSGYQAITAVSSHRAMLFGDNCANSWGCPAGDSGWTIDGEYRIWGRTLDVVPTDPGRVDLVGAVEAGDVTVTTDLVADQAGLGSLALFDGSLAPGSRLTGTGETLIEFSEPHLVTRLGLATAPGSAVASVLVFDGDSWIDPQISTGVGGDRSLRAFEPPAPRPIEAIRITFERDGQGALSELELYTTTNSFENESVGAPPRAATESTMTSVVRTDAQRPGQALRLHDTADDAMARIAFAFPTDASAASIRLRASALPGGLLFGLSDAETTILHLTIDAEGAIRRYDVEAETWIPVAPAGTVDPFEWMDIVIERDGGLRIDGEDIDIGAPLMAVAETLYVTSTGTLPVGVDLLIDDLTFAPSR